jgi:hypothetical protein
MSKVVACRMLMPVGVVIDIEDGGTPHMVVPTLYDPMSDEVFVMGHDVDHIYENVVKAVKDYVKKTNNTVKGVPSVGQAVDYQTWDQIRILRGLATPPVQEQ